MTIKNRNHQRLAAPLLLTGLIAFAGCAAPTSEPPVTSASASSEASPSAEPTPEVVDTDKVMREFVTAIYADASAIPEGLYAPGSVAEKYITHLNVRDTAYKANGDYFEASASDQPTLTFGDGVATAKHSTGDSYAWSDFEYDENGLVTSWSTPSGNLSSLLLSTEFTGTVAGNSVMLMSAYKSNGGHMFVVLKITAGSARIDITAPYDAQYVASDGIAYAVEASSAPRQSIPAGAAGYVVLQFPQAPFGGTVYLEGYNEGNYDRWKAEIPIR